MIIWIIYTITVLLKHILWQIFHITPQSKTSHREEPDFCHSVQPMGDPHSNCHVCHVYGWSWLLPKVQKWAVELAGRPRCLPHTLGPMQIAASPHNESCHQLQELEPAISIIAGCQWQPKACKTALSSLVLALFLMLLWGLRCSPRLLLTPLSDTEPVQLRTMVYL